MIKSPIQITRRSALHMIFAGSVCNSLLPKTAIAHSHQSWIELDAQTGWGTYSTLRIYDSDRVIRKILKRKGAIHPRTRRFHVAKNTYARCWEILYAWLEPPHLPGPDLDVITGPYTLPTDGALAIVKYYDHHTQVITSYTQKPAAADETVPNVAKLFNRLRQEIDVPF